MVEEWRQGLVELPRAGKPLLLLVPKGIVRLRMDYDADEYYDDYIIPFLRDEEIQGRVVTGLKSSRMAIPGNGATPARSCQLLEPSRRPWAAV